MRTLGKVQFGRRVLNRLNSHPVSRLHEAKGLSRAAARSFAALRMTGLDLAVGEELSRSFEPCLSSTNQILGERIWFLRLCSKHALVLGMYRLLPIAPSLEGNRVSVSRTILRPT